MPRNKRQRLPATAADPPLDVAERRRSDLLEAAFTLIAERGLEGLRTRDVAARAGVNISTLHYYFGTKEALLLAVVEHATERFARRGAERDGARSATRDASLRAHFEISWRNFRATPELALVLQELVLRGQRDDETRAAFRALYEGWNRVVEDLLRRLQKGGRLRADVDPRAAARVVTSFIIGANVQLGVNPKAFDFLDVARKLERWLSA